MRLKRFLKQIYYPLFRLQLRVACYVSDRLHRRHFGRPLPPALLRFRVSESLSIREFDAIGLGCADLVAGYLKRSGLKLDRGERILDFGCGCGRTLSWLSSQYPDAVWHGVDIDEAAVDWCRAHLSNAKTQLISPDPPLPFEDKHFDALYCFSVFTQLDEPLQDQWLRDLGRVLKPGGILLITVHGEFAAQAGLDSNGRFELDRSGFLHRTSSKLKGVVPARYHTTWHKPEYILERLERLVGAAEYHTIKQGMQDMVIGRKPFDGELSWANHNYPLARPAEHL